MTHTSTEQPEALRLAEFFESMQKSSHRWYDGTPVHEKAAAELRRLHAENEVLRKQLQSAQAVQQAVQPTLISKLESIALKFASAYEAAGRETYREDAEKQARKAKQHLTAALQSALATHPTQQGLDAPMVNMAPPATSRDRWMYEQGRLAEREIICAAIKSEDDHCVDQGDYMLDSDDCIKIVRGEWERPDFSGNAAQAKQGGADHG